jgi:hypothetical protein
MLARKRHLRVVQDNRAPPLQGVRKPLHPLIWPAMIAGCLLAWGVAAYFVGKGLVSIVLSMF